MSQSLKTRLIIDAEPNPGWFNMAADEYSAASVIHSPYQGVVRFYTWQPPAVSLGYHQTRSDIDFYACEGCGWDVVRRPTGGRALLHLDDLSYSIVMRADANIYKQLRFIYEQVAAALIEAFARWNIAAEFVATASRRPQTVSIGKPNRLCLSSRVRGEVSISGRKVTTAAQRVYGKSILQHGSILITGDTGAIAKVMRLNHHERIDTASNLSAQTICLEEAAGIRIESQELVEALVDILPQYLKLGLSLEAWQPSEIERVTYNRHLFEIYSTQPVPEVVTVGA